MTERVLIFSTVYLPLIGGAEVAMKELTDRMPDIRFDLICANVRPDLPATERIGNVTVHRVGSGRAWDKWLLPFLGPWKARQLEQGTPYPLAWSLMASYGGFAALAYAWLRPKTRLLLTLQEGDPLEHYDRRAGVLSFLHKAIFKRADAVQAISRFLAGWAVRMGFEGTPVVIPNGVDVDAFSAPIGPERRQELRHRHGFTDEDVVLMTASRLSRKNALDDVIRALAELPPAFKFLIAGEGEEGEALQAQAKALGVLPRTVFHGNASHEELPGLLQASDIFIRPSRSEGLGNAFLEAMAAGLPVIGTNVGGIPDFLTDGETGVFCLPDNPASIVMAVKRIAHDPALRDQLVRNGQALVRERYAWDGIAVSIRAMLET